MEGCFVLFCSVVKCTCVYLPVFYVFFPPATRRPGTSPSPLFLIVILNRFFKRGILGAQQNREGGAELFPTPAAPHAHTASPVIDIPLRVGRLSRLTNLQRHLTIAQGPGFTLRFAVGVVHSVGFGTRVMTRIHHDSLMRNRFTTLKHPPCSTYPPPISPNFWQPLTLSLFYSFASSIMSWS